MPGEGMRKAQLWLPAGFRPAAYPFPIDRKGHSGEASTRAKTATEAPPRIGIKTSQPSPSLSFPVKASNMRSCSQVCTIQPFPLVLYLLVQERVKIGFSDNKKIIYKLYAFPTEHKYPPENPGVFLFTKIYFRASISGGGGQREGEF